MGESDNNCSYCQKPVSGGALKCASCGSWAVPLTKRPYFKWIVSFIVGLLLIAYIINGRMEVAKEKEWCRRHNVSEQQCSDAFGHL